MHYLEGQQWQCQRPEAPKRPHRERHCGYTRSAEGVSKEGVEGAKCQIILHLRQSHILPFIFSSPHPTKSKAPLWRENGWLLLLH